jgi:hypothetical protein
VIGYPAGAARNHREHIVRHAVGHMVAEHEGTTPVSSSTVSGLLPDLDPEMVRAVLGRSVYGVVEEQEAELIASLVMQRALEPRIRASGWEVDDEVQDAVTRRMERAFRSG